MKRRGGDLVVLANTAVSLGSGDVRGVSEGVCIGDTGSRRQRRICCRREAVALSLPLLEDELLDDGGEAFVTVGVEGTSGAVETASS